MTPEELNKKVRALYSYIDMHASKEEKDEYYSAVDNYRKTGVYSTKKWSFEDKINRS